MFKYLAALQLMLWLLPICVAAQDSVPIVVDERVLSQFGETETVQMTLPIRRGIGIVSTQDVPRHGASALRLHFVIETAAQSPSWAVQVRNKKNKEVWTYSPVGTSEMDFWSGLIPGETAIVEVLGVADVTDLRLTIDRVIECKKPTLNRTLIANKLEPITGESATIRNWGRSVARLVYTADKNGKQYLCTGFLVAADLFMTNNHCIQSPKETRSGLVEFDFDKTGATIVTLTFKEMLETNADLDFTLLRLNATPGRQPLVFDTSAPGTRPLLVIQHAAGKPKQVSIENCKVLAAQVAGVTAQLTDFGHGCDSLNGSSGSPVMDLSSGKVFGLHHLGFLPNEEPRNRAVSIQQILEFLKNNLKDAEARQALGLPPQ
jgi:V8-like Glu-specific endopeptidase